MSMWKKTMVYLGLVDEVPPDSAQPQRVTGEPQYATAEPQYPPDDLDHPPATRVVSSGLGQIEGRRVEPPVGIRRPSGYAHRDRDRDHESEGTRAEMGTVRPVQSLDRQAEVLEPFTFEDAKQLADHIRERTPVVLNLREVDPDLVRRIIDFSTGLTYALDGSMRKIGTAVILVLPPRITLGRDEKRRLAALGLYELEIEAR